MAYGGSTPMMLLIDGHIVDTECETPPGGEEVKPGVRINSTGNDADFSVRNISGQDIIVAELGVRHTAIRMMHGSIFFLESRSRFSPFAREPKI